MVAFGRFCVVALVSIISITQAIDVFQPVEGKCTDLPTVKEFNSTKLASGEWYYQYGSIGKEGDKCSSGHVVQRGNENFIDMLLHDADTNEFVNMQNDLTTDPEKPGIYTNDQGAVGYVLAADPELKKYFCYIQCIEDNKQTLAMFIVLSRVRSPNEELETAYKETSIMLETKKLLPKTHKIIQTDCDGM